MRATELIERYLGHRVDPRHLAVTRIMVGCAGLLMGLEVYGIGTRILRPDVIVLPLLPGLPRLSPAALPAVVAVWMACALLVALGALFRPAALLLAALAGYVLLSDQQLYSNHYYLLAVELLLLAAAPADAAWALRPGRRRRPASVAGWAAVLLQLQITAVYLFAALSKLNPSYLSGAVLAAEPGLMRLVGALPLATALSLPALAAGAVLVELTIVACLWTPRLRPAAPVLGALLHGTILATMGAELSSGLGLAAFGLATLAPYALFFAAPRAAAATSASGSPAPRTP